MKDIEEEGGFERFRDDGKRLILRATLNFILTGTLLHYYPITQFNQAITDLLNVVGIVLFRIFEFFPI